MGELTVGQVQEYIAKSVTNEQLAKASMAAATALQDVVNYEQVIANPENLGDWLTLYRRHVWAFAAIFARANVVAQLGVKVQRIEGTDFEDVEDLDAADPTGRLSKLVRLLNVRPNPQMSSHDLLELLVIHLDTTGRAYWETVYGEREKKVGGKTVKSERVPVEYWPVQPDYLEPIPKKDGNGVEKYRFQTRRYARTKFFSPEEIVPFYYTDPTCPQFSGLGRIMPAVDDLQLDKQAARWNLDFFCHGLTPEGIISTDKAVTTHEMQKIGDQIREFLAGKGRRILVLSKGMNWQSISVPPKDVDFLEGRKENRQAVLASLGVPPVLVGLLEHAKYDNYALQLEAFNRITIVPLLRKLEGAMNVHLLPQWGQDLADAGFYLTFDAEHLTAENEDRLTDRLERQLRSGLRTPNECRELLGLQPYDEAKGQTGGDAFYMATTLQPVAKGAEDDGGDLGGANSLELADDAANRRLAGLEGGVTKALAEMEGRLREDLLAEVRKAREE